MENILFLETPLHRNSFPEDLFGEGGVTDSLLMTFDGTILGVDKLTINSYLEDSNSRMVRIGYAKPPKDFKVVDEESFYRYLSFCHYCDD